MSSLYIEDNRKVITFTDGTVYNLGYWIVKRPYEGGTVPDNIITNGESLLTVNAIACLDNNGVYHGLDGEKIDNNGNKYEGNPAGKWVKITGVNGGSYTVQLSNTVKAVTLAVAPVDFPNSQDNIKAGDVIINFGGYYNRTTTTVYASSSFNENSADIGELTEWADVYYHNADNTDRKKIYITVFGNVINNNGFLDVAAVSKYDAGSYTDIISANVLEQSLAIRATRKLSVLISGYEQPVDQNDDDPYGPGGYSYPGGGNGTFDRSGDAIPVPGLPTLSALNTGFVTIWTPTASQLRELYNYMWSNAFDLESLKKLFANPIDCILGFGIIPLIPTVSGVDTIRVGNISTGVNASKVSAQYYKIDCGTLYLKEIFGSYLDYEPYTELDLFLPFIGCVKVSADDFIKTNTGKLSISYNVDILNGACIAFLSGYDAENNTTVSYEYNGNVLTQLPITGNDFRNMYSSILGIAGNIASGAAHIATGNAAGVLNDVTNAAHNVMSAKPTVQRAGSLSSTGGLLANRKPFFIRNIPQNATATMQNLYSGYPSHMTRGVVSQKDYTEFEVVYLHNVPATDPELKEIEEILKTGVIL